MGAGQSSSASSAQRSEALLARLAGPDAIPHEDEFWGQLLSWQVPLASEDPAAVANALAPHCHQLMIHNALTHNFQRLVLHTLELLSAANSSKPSLSAANSLHLLSLLLKFMVEACSPSSLLMVFEGAPSLPQSVQGQQSLLPLFINRLVLVLCNLQPTDELSYLLLLEALLLLLVCASTQLHTQQTAAPLGSHPLLEALMGQQQSAAALVSALLALVVARPVQPQKLALYAPPSDGTMVMRLVRTAAATVLWIPRRTYEYILRHSTSGGATAGAEAAPSPLGDLALALLLLLAHYPAHHAQLPNGVKQGLAALQDAAGGGGAHAPDAGGGGVRARAGAVLPSPGAAAAAAAAAVGGGGQQVPSVNFARLYELFAHGPQSEASTLLLYTLLHGSRSFLEYVLVRSDPETLLLPVLQQLYSAHKGRANHLYMLQIIVLILSQDMSFSHNIHKVTLPGAPWYRDRLLARISLGSLVYVVLLRTAHRNVGQLQDLYLPTNTLAALANLAPQVTGLHSHAAQRLVGLAASLARRWTKLNQAAAEAGTPPPPDVQVLGDFLRILLDVINCVLTTHLARNPQLVYALLHKQEVFEALRGVDGFAELVDNLQVVIDYFNNRLDGVKGNTAAAPEGAAEWNVSRVLELVQNFAQSWRGDRLRHLPELRFVYEEEASPEEFFVPYAWSLAIAATGGRLVAWNLGGAALLRQLSGELGGDGGGGLEGAVSNASRWSEDAFQSGELNV